MSSLPIAVYRILTRPLILGVVSVLVLCWYLSLQFPQVRIVRWGPLSIPIGWYPEYDPVKIGQENTIRTLGWEYKNRLDECNSGYTSHRLTPTAYNECVAKVKKDNEAVMKPFQPVTPTTPSRISKIESIAGFDHPYYYLHVYGQKWFNTHVVVQPHFTTYIHGVHVDTLRPFIVDCGSRKRYHSQFGLSGRSNQDVVLTGQECSGLIKIKKDYDLGPEDDLQIQLIVEPRAESAAPEGASFPIK